MGLLLNGTHHYLVKIIILIKSLIVFKSIIKNDIK